VAVQDPTVCNDQARLEALPFSPATRDAISFSGAGLYHFKAIIAARQSHCALSAEFKLFVFEAPSEVPVILITVSVTGVAIVVLLFVYYKHFVYRMRRPHLHID